MGVLVGTEVGTGVRVGVACTDVGVGVGGGVSVGTGAPTAVGVGSGALVTAGAWVGPVGVTASCSQSNDDWQRSSPGPGTSTHRPNRHSRCVSPWSTGVGEVTATAALVGVGVGCAMGVVGCGLRKKYQTVPPRARSRKTVIPSKRPTRRLPGPGVVNDSSGSAGIGGASSVAGSIGGAGMSDSGVIVLISSGTGVSAVGSDVGMSVCSGKPGADPSSGLCPFWGG